MYSRYNIPQYNYNMQRNIAYPMKGQMPVNYSPNDRFFPGGFIAPFLLGGIAGSLITRPNYQPYPMYPPVVYYPPMQQPYYSNTNYYY